MACAVVGGSCRDRRAGFTARIRCQRLAACRGSLDGAGGTGGEPSVFRSLLRHAAARDSRHGLPDRSKFLEPAHARLEPVSCALVVPSGIFGSWTVAWAAPVAEFQRHQL